MTTIIGVRFKSNGKMYYFDPQGLEIAPGTGVIVETARGVEFDGSFAKKVRLMIPLCVPLLVSSVRKTNSAAIAAEVRGFNLRTRTSGYRDYPLHAEDFVALAVCVAVLAAAIALAVVG